MPQITDIIPDKRKAIFHAKRQLPAFVYDAVNLEGIHYTLPEVQTLLDGVTVGGHRLNDQIITLNQARAWKKLFHLIETGQFLLTKEVVCELHTIAAKEEALEWGDFRKGGVTIAGTSYLPPSHQKLDSLWQEMAVEAVTIENIYDRAIYVFLQMARTQFFYNVNKRLGRFMMNGILLAAGYPAINLPAKRQQEFNQLMLDFYLCADRQPMTDFMKSCLDENTIKIMCE